MKEGRMGMKDRKEGKEKEESSLDIQIPSLNRDIQIPSLNRDIQIFK